MSFDPDFIIDVNGEDVTKYVHSWSFMDSEKRSTLTVDLKNPEQKLSNKFDTGQKVSIIFGYVGNQGEKVTMTIKKYEESYSVEEATDFIRVTGMDCMSDTTEGDNVEVESPD